VVPVFLFSLCILGQISPLLRLTHLRCSSSTSLAKFTTDMLAKNAERRANSKHASKIDENELPRTIHTQAQIGSHSKITRKGQRKRTRVILIATVSHQKCSIMTLTTVILLRKSPPVLEQRSIFENIAANYAIMIETQQYNRSKMPRKAPETRKMEKTWSSHVEDTLGYRGMAPLEETGRPAIILDLIVSFSLFFTTVCFSDSILY